MWQPLAPQILSTRLGRVIRKHNIFPYVPVDMTISISRQVNSQKSPPHTKSSTWLSHSNTTDPQTFLYAFRTSNIHNSNTFILEDEKFQTTTQALQKSKSVQDERATLTENHRTYCSLYTFKLLLTSFIRITDHIQTLLGPPTTLLERSD